MDRCQNFDNNLKKLKMTKTLGNFFPIKKNNFLIFLFHGVIKKNLFSVRNYNNKHILKKI